MRLLIMGAGALGSVAGGLMAKAGHTVTLVGRPAHFDAIRANGLQITGIWGDHTVTDLSLCTDPSELRPGNYDFVLIAVKSYSTAAAIEAVKHVVDDDTLVCSYQNGLGNFEIIAEAVGRERAFGARVIFGARIVEPGHADVTVIANPTALGPYQYGPYAERIQTIVEAMDEAGLPTVYTDKIETVLWSKVAYNCALNPMSALLDVPYGEVGGGEDTKAIIHDIIHELYAVGNAEAVHLEPESPEAYLDHFFTKLLPPTAQHYASMREDLLQKRRTEIDALNGAIWKMGERHKIPTPANQLLTRLIHARESQYLKGQPPRKLV